MNKKMVFLILFIILIIASALKLFVFDEKVLKEEKSIKEKEERFFKDEGASYDVDRSLLDNIKNIKGYKQAVFLKGEFKMFNAEKGDYETYTSDIMLLPDGLLYYIEIQQGFKSKRCEQFRGSYNIKGDTLQFSLNYYPTSKAILKYKDNSFYVANKEDYIVPASHDGHESVLSVFTYDPSLKDKYIFNGDKNNKLAYLIYLDIKEKGRFDSIRDKKDIFIYEDEKDLFDEEREKKENEIIEVRDYPADIVDVN